MNWYKQARTDPDEYRKLIRAYNKGMESYEHGQTLHDNLFHPVFPPSENPSEFDLLQMKQKEAWDQGWEFAKRNSEQNKEDTYDREQDEQRERDWYK